MQDPYDLKALSAITRQDSIRRRRRQIALQSLATAQEAARITGNTRFLEQLRALYRRSGWLDADTE